VINSDWFERLLGKGTGTQSTQEVVWPRKFLVSWCLVGFVRSGQTIVVPLISRVQELYPRISLFDMSKYEHRVSTVRCPNEKLQLLVRPALCTTPVYMQFEL
jgi:hypothetical protein